MSVDASVERVAYSDAQLFNCIIARGPGQGLDRLQWIERDATSITAYGERQYILDVPDAEDVGDLELAATQFLTGVLSYGWWVGPPGGVVPSLTEEVGIDRRDPQVHAEVTAYFDIADPPDIERGDVVKLIIQELSIEINEVIREIDWGETSAGLFLGEDAPDFLDIFRQEIDRVMPPTELGLLIPFNFTAVPNLQANGGITLRVTSVSGATDQYEVRASQSDGFNPDARPADRRGSFTRLNWTEGNPGETWYFRARRYDQGGNFSAWTGQVSAVYQ